MDSFIKKLMTILMVMPFIMNCNVNPAQERIVEKDSSSLAKNNIQSIPSVDTREIRSSGNILDSTSNPAFFKFAMNFSKRNLPYNLQIGDSDWIRFTPSDFKEIHRDTAVKYLFENDIKKVVDPEGGYCRYFYGYRVTIRDTLLGLLCFRSSSGYSGYILSIFGERGTLLNDFFLAGTKGEYEIEAQKESKIYENGLIEIKEIVLSNDAIGSNEPVEGKVKKSVYRISANGTVVQTQEPIVVNKIVVKDRDRYRLSEKD